MARLSEAATPPAGPPAAAPPRVRMHGVTKAFGAAPVLRGIDLEVAAGEVLALVGPSGGGKSTLLRLVNGLEARDGGTLEVLGTEVPLGGEAADPAAPWWRPLRQRMGFVFQAFHLYPHLTALENVALAPERVAGLAREQARERAAALLERVGLRSRAAARPRELSGGQQQRVAIARALAMDPEILLCDEPTSALDPQTTGEVLAVLREVAAEHARTLLVVTHELAFAREVADRVAFLEQGTLLELGPARATLEAPRHPRLAAFLAGRP
ncbi:MAG: amino acid ABC transporter ATP-binding protein [Planctomycetia bacterium]